MRFQVPQFIEVEDKIFGPLTFKQFVYLAGGAGLCVVFFVILPFYLALIPMVLVAGFSAALAFYKINGKPFIFTLEAGVKYFFNPKLYIWKKEEEKKTAKMKEREVESTLGFIPQLSTSKLKDLTWSLSTKKDSLNPATSENNDTTM